MCCYYTAPVEAISLSGPAFWLELKKLSVVLCMDHITLWNEMKGEGRDEERTLPLYNAVEFIVFRCFFSHKIVTRGPLKTENAPESVWRTRWGELKRSPGP